MTETEKKALALLNAVCAEWEVSPATEDEMDGSACFAALTRAIEQHEAFKREVSDAVEAILNCTNVNKRYAACLALNRFTIAKPDPLVEALKNAGLSELAIEQIRAAIQDSGGKIVWEGE